MKIRLQIGVAVVFTILTTTLLGIVVAFLYIGNRNLALKTAQEEMVQARTWSVWNMRATIHRTEQTVSSIASFVGAFPSDARSLGGLNTLHALAQGNDHFYGLYFGFEADGAFYQNVVLPSDMQVFGPGEHPVPDNATRALRIIDGAGIDRRETFFWSDEEYRSRSFFERSPSYDPRERPWYIGAVETEGLYVTEPYVFESTGRLGVTFAERIIDPSGNLIGVAGIDMTMSALSRILEEMRIGEHGLVFMLDHSGQLMSYTGTRADGQGARFLASDPDLRLQTTSDPVRQAVLHWQENETSFFHFQPLESSAPQIASVAPVTAIFGREYTLGLSVPEEEFIGEINRNTARAMQISGIVLIMAIALTAIIARLLSSSLRQVTEEANRISNFELGDSLELKTKLQEVSELGTAMSSMKAGLASFGAYVPKDLVRSIVSRGERQGVGGTSKDVTLLFSDLQGFTARTEGLAPEQLMPALSKYFEVMETQIAQNSGSVDKYMGDAIMAMWNAPLDDPHHVEHACRAALACLHVETSINQDPELAPLAPLSTRFGLHTGRVIVGNVGSLSRMQYTALGAVVNLASRIEGLNKVYGTQILVSRAVAQQVSETFVMREVDIVFPAGTSQPTTLFELMGEQDPESAFATSDRRRKEAEGWATCYALYRAGAWSAALEALEAFRSDAINVLLVDAYIRRCRDFIAHPPPENWDGVYTFTSK